MVVGSSVKQEIPGWTFVDDGRALQSRQTFDVPAGCGEALQLSARIRIQNYGVPNNQDPQFGFGQMAFRGLDGFHFAFWITEMKVYAYYARLPTGQTPADYYASASYLIPIADVQQLPAENDLFYNNINNDHYEIYLNRYDKLVSWRMNGYELLRIRPTGVEPIDTKFMIADFGGWDPTEGFPAEGFFVVGNGVPSYIGSPHTACQGTLFNQCLESISNAKLTECQYAPLYNGTRPIPDVGVLSRFDDMTVMTRYLVDTCPQWTCDLRHMDCESVGTCTAIGEQPEGPPMCLPEYPEVDVQQPTRLGWQRSRQAAPITFQKKK